MSRHRKRTVPLIKQQENNEVGDPSSPARAAIQRVVPRVRAIASALSSSKLWRADFNQFGPQAIALVREKKPEIYMRVVADLLPKEANINVEAGEAFVKLWGKISDGLGDEMADRLDDEPSVGSTNDRALAALLAQEQEQPADLRH